MYVEMSGTYSRAAGFFPRTLEEWYSHRPSSDFLVCLYAEMVLQAQTLTFCGDKDLLSLNLKLLHAAPTETSFP